jgi:hypothetical protein
MKSSWLVLAGCLAATGNAGALMQVYMKTPESSDMGLIAELGELMRPHRTSLSLSTIIRWRLLLINTLALSRLRESRMVRQNRRRRRPLPVLQRPQGTRRARQSLHRGGSCNSDR